MGADERRTRYADVKQRLVSIPDVPRGEVEARKEAFMAELGEKLEQLGLTLFDPAHPSSDGFIVHLSTAPDRRNSENVTLLAKITFPQQTPENRVNHMEAHDFLDGYGELQR